MLLINSLSEKLLRVLLCLKRILAEPIVYETQNEFIHSPEVRAILGLLTTNPAFSNKMSAIFLTQSILTHF
jgi:hypothetical protein